VLLLYSLTLSDLSLYSIVSIVVLGVQDRLYVSFALLFMASSVLHSCSHEVRWGPMGVISHTLGAILFRGMILFVIESALLCLLVN